MAFNIDADPIDANWLRWKGWQVGCKDLPELFDFLGVSTAPKDVQVRYLRRLNRFLREAPEALQGQVEVFLGAAG